MNNKGYLEKIIFFELNAYIANLGFSIKKNKLSGVSGCLTGIRIYL